MNFQDIIKGEGRKAEVFRFAITGGFCTLLQYGVYVVFVDSVGVPPVVSTVISYAISFIANFLLSSFFTFRSSPNAKKGLAFLFSHVFNMGLQTGLVAIFKGLVGDTLALLPALAICVPVNYFMVRFAFTSKRFASNKNFKNNNMKVAFASDHAGFGLKEYLKGILTERGYSVMDFGTFSEASCDYPDFAHPAAKSVEKGECDFGIAICGTGNGIAMTLNKHQKIRAALCWRPEIAELARQHNDANILVLPARFVSDSEALKIMDAYLKSQFEGGRHKKRIDKIPVK